MTLATGNTISCGNYFIVKMYLRFSRNSEAYASELLENLKYIFNYQIVDIQPLECLFIWRSINKINSDVASDILTS